jgi:hypothetical protein
MISSKPDQANQEDGKALGSLPKLLNKASVLSLLNPHSKVIEQFVVQERMG